LIAAPAAACFEHEIERLAGVYGELDAERYDSLYLMLKSYLSIGETGVSRGEAHDTKGLQPVVRDAVARSLLSALRASRLPPAVSTSVERSLPGYIRRLGQGEITPVAEDRKVVALARRRLRRLPNAHTLYRSIATRLAAGAPAITLDTVVGGDGPRHLVSDGAVSTIYTAAGWHMRVRGAVDESARDPVASDWVLGVVADVGRPAARDSDELRRRMRAAYADDFVAHWTALLSGIRLRPWRSPAECAEGLRAIAGGESELTTLLEAVARLADVRVPADGAEQRLGKLAGKATGGISDSLSSAGDGFAGMVGRRGPLEGASAVFDALRDFVDGKNGGELSLSHYRSLLAAVADALDKVKDSGPSATIETFGGGDNDPLYEAWRRTEAFVAGLSPRLREPLGAVLRAPLRETGQTVSASLADAVNRTWHEQVSEPFRRRLAGRFPLGGGGEAPYDDVMAFFRPSTGVFWGFYERALSSFVIKRDGAWQGKTLGCVALSPTAELCAALAAAEVISRRFYLSDGETREMVMTIVPVGNGRPAELTVDGQKAALAPGGGGVRVRWPLEAPSRGAALRVQLSDGSTRELVEDGPWGLIRLLRQGQLTRINDRSFTVVWSVDVQRMFVIPLSYRVEVSGDGHPFVRNPFAEFRCPERAVSTESANEQAIARRR
ncbi:MAG: hypothetical protein GF331_22650, partial [Chitinivibrionales bacterium]|nr:hypothetical protein [Chitinivibrionales bacterium]